VTRGWNSCIITLVPDYPVPTHLQTFGAPLELLMKHPLNRNRNTPLVFQTCISYLLGQGVTVEGIFRIPGNSQVIEEIKSKWNAGFIVDYKNYDVPDIAGLLKAFVRQLPDPICVKEFFSIVGKTSPIQIRID